MAIEGHEGFEFSDWEMSQEDRVTPKHISTLKPLYPDSELCFLMGETPSVLLTVGIIMKNYFLS